MLAQTPIQTGLSTEGDTEALKKLWRYCFLEDRTGPFVDWYFANRFQPQTTYVAKVGQSLAGAVYAPSVTIKLRGKAHSLPYIQGVAIAPQHRGQGIANRLLGDCLNRLCSQQVPLAVLKPFQPEFYQKTGWTNFAYLLKYKLPLAELSKTKPNRELRYVHPEDSLDYVKDLQQIYQAWLQDTDQQVVRQTADFCRLLEDHCQDGGQALLAYRQQQPIGYMLFTLSGGCFFIRELAYTEPAALYSLLALAKEHDSQTHNTLLVAPDLEKSRLLLPDTLAGVNLYPFAMARLVNVQAAFEGLPGGQFLTQPIYLQILDCEIAFNQGFWRLEQGKDGLKMVKLTKIDTKISKKVLKFDTNTLTKIFMGCYTYDVYRDCKFTFEKSPEPNEELARANQDFAQLFPRLTTYFYEYF